MASKVKGIKLIEKGVYRIDVQANGIRTQKRIKAESVKEARAIRDELKVELRKQTNAPQGERTRLNAGIEEAWEKLQGGLTTKPRKTFLRYKKTFWRIFGEFRTSKFPHIKSVSEVSVPFLVEYTNYYTNDLGYDPNGGLKAEITILKAIMRRLKKLGYCPKEIEDILKEIKKPRQRKKEYPDIPNDQLKKLFSFMKQNRPDYYYPLYFVCRTGRRINETTLIQRKDVKWDGFNPIRIQIRAETTKTDEDAPIEKLDEDLRKAIKEAHRASLKRKTTYLFVNRIGNKCSSGRVRDYLKMASRQMIGIAITPHYFRHRFLTRCASNKGVPMADAMSIAGIKDIKVILKYYAHISVEGQDKVLAASRI
jgi:integrase